MFVAASTHCFSDCSFEDACQRISDLEYDRIELWLSNESNHLKPAELADDPEKFCTRYRELTRLTPIAVCCAEDIAPQVLAGVSKACKLLRVAQICVPASPLGTPFNTEIDRLKEFVGITGPDGVQLSIATGVGDLTEDPHTAVELCQAVKGLGLTLDPSHYICGPNLSKPFDQVYPFVHHTHLRDTSPNQLQVPVGLGELDYSRVISQLEKCDYRLSLTVDLIPDLHESIDARPLEMRKLRMLLDTLL